MLQIPMTLEEPLTSRELTSTQGTATPPTLLISSPAG